MAVHVYKLFRNETRKYKAILPATNELVVYNWVSFLAMWAVFDTLYL